MLCSTPGGGFLARSEMKMKVISRHHTAPPPPSSFRLPAGLLLEPGLATLLKVSIPGTNWNLEGLMNHNRIVKEQILHIAFGAMFFVIIGLFAVGLDLASGMVKKVGVTPFTSSTLELSAHAILVLDLVLFFVYLVMTSIDLVKGMVKHD